MTIKKGDKVEVQYVAPGPEIRTTSGEAVADEADGSVQVRSSWGGKPFETACRTVGEGYPRATLPKPVKKEELAKVEAKGGAK